MYVCLCNAYREREVREIALSGARTVAEAYAALGNGPCCGRCVPYAQALIDATRQAGHDVAAADGSRPAQSDGSTWLCR